MNRNLVSCVAAFALMFGSTLAMSSPAEAGHGLLKRIHCKKVAFFQKLKNRGSGCCEPAPTCCEPAPEPCCAPEPAAEPCCGAVEAAPVSDCGCGGSPVAPVMMEAAPVSDCGCGGEVAMEAPAEMGYVSDSVETYEAPVASDEGFDLAPGEVMVPGSLQTIGTSEVASEEAAEEAAPVAEEAVAQPQADPATDSPESSSDNVEEQVMEAAEEAAPPTPTADPTTDA